MPTSPRPRTFEPSHRARLAVPIFPFPLFTQVLGSSVPPWLCRLAIVPTPSSHHIVRDFCYRFAPFTPIYLIFVPVKSQVAGPRGLTTRFLATHALLCYYLSYIAPQRFPRERGSQTPCVVIVSPWPVRHLHGIALHSYMRGPIIDGCFTTKVYSTNESVRIVLHSRSTMVSDEDVRVFR